MNANELAVDFAHDRGICAFAGIKHDDIRNGDMQLLEIYARRLIETNSPSTYRSDLLQQARQELESHPNPNYQHSILI